MSDQEKFLARWSRRKREGGAEETPPAGKTETPETKIAESPSAASPASKETEKPGAPLDLSKLPSLDSITAETDIRAFLKPGVPADLSHAALRRAWSADPAIRDFVGLQEYAWDFNTDEMFGFGPLAPTDDVRKLLAQAIGEPESVERNAQQTADTPESAERAADEERTPRNEPQDDQPHEAHSSSEKDLAAVEDAAPKLQRENEILHLHSSDVASQHDDSDRPLPRRRKSGGALPT